jgi:carbamoyl-phosphate synthase large subunit
MRVALAKALERGPRAAACPTHGDRRLALVSLADRDKPLLPRLAAALAAAGYDLAATDGTRAALAAAGFDAEPVARLAEGGEATRTSGTGLPDVIGLIESGRVGLVVNTPTPRSGAVRDAAQIRLTAISEGVLCLTAIETAVAAAEAMEPAVAARVAEVRALDAWILGRAGDRGGSAMAEIGR